MFRSAILVPALSAGAVLLAVCRPDTQPASRPAPAAASSAAAVCTPPATDVAAPLRGGADYDPLGPAQRALAMKLLAIFENRETELQYGYVENLDDGRGFTAGALGFTTGTSDAHEVIRVYERLVRREGSPEGSLIHIRAFQPYRPVLERFDEMPLGDPRRASVEELQGFERAWSDAAYDPHFRAAQDSVAESMYFVPALRLAHEVGLESALSRSALIDAIVQHGGGDDPDGLPAMLATVLAEEGRVSGITDERHWLGRFLDLREEVLSCAHGAATREAWSESVTRVDVYEQLLQTGNMRLAPPLVFQLDGFEWVIDLDSNR